MKAVRTVLLVVMSVILLGGCVKVDMDLTVSSDDTISGTAVLAVDKSIPSAEQLQQQMEAGLPPGVRVEPYEDDTYRGITAYYDKVPLTAFAGQGPEGLQTATLRREGDFYVYGQADAPPPTPVPGLENAVYRIRLTFPGEVVETNGVADGNSVEWTDPGVTPYARAEAAPNLLVPILLGVLGLLVVAGLATGAVLLIRRRRAAAATTAAAGTGAPGAAGAGGPGAPGGYDPTSFTGVTQQVDEPWAQAPPSYPGSSATPGRGGYAGVQQPDDPDAPNPWSAEGARRAESDEGTIWRRPDGS